MVCLIPLCNENNEKLMDSVQDVLRYQYLKIIIIKVVTMLLKSFVLFVWTDLHRPINEIKQMPKCVQMVTAPQILYPYRVSNDKSHSTTEREDSFWSCRCLVITLPLIDDNKYWFWAHRTGLESWELIDGSSFLNPRSSVLWELLWEWWIIQGPLALSQQSPLHQTVLCCLLIFYLALISTDLQFSIGHC